MLVNSHLAILTLLIFPFLKSIEISPPNVNLVKFWLYPRHRDVSYREEIQFRNDSSLSSSSFKSDTLTVFIIHGFMLSPTKKPISTIIEAYVNSSFGGNYFALDWNALAGSQLIEYPLIIGNVSPVAKHVQQFISWLVQSHGLDLAGVHILGLSLGAHLAGQVGKAIQKTDGFKVARITGFDPAGPLFWPANPSVNINKDDAHFVDIIHSNQGLYGEKTTEGHVDFILNNGIIQPGCDLISWCSHATSAVLYAASFQESYFGCECSLWNDPLAFEQCMSRCPNPTRVGLYTPYSARGIYTVVTGRLPQ